MVGRIFSGLRDFARISATPKFDQIGRVQKFKVLGRFIHGDTVGVDRVFAKASAKKEASEAVAKAISKIAPFTRSADLQFFNNIINEVRRSPQNMASLRKFAKFSEDVRGGRPDQAVADFSKDSKLEIDEADLNTQRRLKDPLFRVALLDAAWKASVGEGKLGILLKNRTTDSARDGTRALKSDLRKLAKTDNTGTLEELSKAAGLAKFLLWVKAARGRNADEHEFQQMARDMHGHFEIELSTSPDDAALSVRMSEALSQALTNLLRPKSE